MCGWGKRAGIHCSVVDESPPLNIPGAQFTSPCMHAPIGEAGNEAMHDQVSGGIEGGGEGRASGR